MQLRLYPITQQYVYFWECAFQAAAAFHHWWSLHCTHSSISEVLRRNEKAQSGETGRGEVANWQGGEMGKGHNYQLAVNRTKVW
jgi:hypothetical protein